MKKLILILLFPVFLFAQIDKRVLFIQRYQYATVLNGTSQYWAKSSPSNLDLNGSEMITNANNTGFETNLGDWANFGNHSALRSTVDKRTGTASMRITSSGAGDTTANFMYLPPSALGTMVAGNKYTIELWARSATATSTITLNVGTQSATSGTLSTTFGSFTKVVFNFQALTSTDTLKIYANKAIDSLYVDDVSLTQAYDAMFVAYLIHPQTVSSTQVIVDSRPVSKGYSFYLISGNNTRFVISDGTAKTTSGTIGNINNGAIHCVVATVDRTGSVSLYDNGVADGTPTSITTMGNANSTATIFIGADTGNKYVGMIGSVQIVRFASLPSDIAQTITQISSQKKPLNSYTNGTIVAWYDWSSGGTDKSGSGNHLSPVNSPIIVRVK